MSPGHLRQIAAGFVNRGRRSGRQACRHFGLHRSTFAYQPQDPAPWLAKLKASLRRLSRAFPEWGYAKFTRLLKGEGWQVGARLVQRLRRELGLAIPPKKPRQWIDDAGIKTLYIDPGSSWQNGYVESFNARLRQECLIREQLWSLTEARVVIED